MRVRTYLTCVMAALALAACKKQDAGTAASAANDTVAVTQAAPPPGGTWVDVVNATSAGFMKGNPDAKVKLVEIGALTCPHCREFDEKGVPALLENYVKTGQVSWEFRPFLLHGLDLPANLIARCNGLKTFFPLVRALYKDQPTWVGKIAAAPEDRLAQIQSLPVNQQFAELATLAGLQDWAAIRGVPRAKSDQCLRDEKTVDMLVQQTSDVTNQYPQFPGTPAFILNGKLLDKTASWQALEPQLKAALQ